MPVHLHACTLVSAATERSSTCADVPSWPLFHQFAGQSLRAFSMRKRMFRSGSLSTLSPTSRSLHVRPGEALGQGVVAEWELLQSRAAV